MKEEVLPRLCHLIVVPVRPRPSHGMSNEQSGFDQAACLLWALEISKNQQTSRI